MRSERLSPLLALNLDPSSKRRNLGVSPDLGAFLPTPLALANRWSHLGPSTHPRRALPSAKISVISMPGAQAPSQPRLPAASPAHGARAARPAPEPTPPARPPRAAPGGPDGPEALLGSIWGTEPQGRRPEPGFPLLSARCCRGGQEGEIFTVTNPSLCSGMGTAGSRCLPVPGALCEPQTALKMLPAAGAQCQGCFSAHLPALPTSSHLLQGLSAAPVPSKQEKDHRVPSARLQRLLKWVHFQLICWHFHLDPCVPASRHHRQPWPGL